MIQRRDWVAIVAIGLEVGLMVQPIIFNLREKITEGLVAIGVGAPAPSFLHIGGFIGFVILAPAALFILSELSKRIPLLYQFGKFAAVGSSNAFLDIGFLNLVIILTGISEQAPALAVVATLTALTATVNSFFWNKFWTFEAGRSEGKPLLEVLKFCGVTGVVAIMNGTVTGIAAASIANGGLDPKLAANVGKVIGIFSGLLFNFLGYKFIVFKKPTANASNLPPA